MENKEPEAGGTGGNADASAWANLKRSLGQITTHVMFMISWCLDTFHKCYPNATLDTNVVYPTVFLKLT